MFLMLTENTEMYNIKMNNNNHRVNKFQQNKEYKIVMS